MSAITEPAKQQGQPSQRGDLIQVVAFHLGQEHYAVPIGQVKEIILVESITHIPQMPDFVDGVINLRGQVIPVIDLRKRLGLEAGPLSDQSRIMVARLGNRIVGLIVDAVSQVRKFGTDALQPAPETIAGLTSKFLTGIARFDDQMVICLDLDQVLNMDELQGLTEVATEELTELVETEGNQS